jgi:hypothetical protein
VQAVDFTGGRSFGERQLARYVHGELAVVLLPAFSFALWLGTLSLVILAASLFSIAHIQGWSARHEKQYRQLDHEERATGAFLDELRADGNRAGVAARQAGSLTDATAPAGALHVSGKSAAGFVAMAIVTVVLAAGGSTGCSTVLPSAASSTKAEMPPPYKPTSLQVFVDTSGSCVRPALEESWKTLRRELPEIIETRGISQLAVWQFDMDGWSPRKVIEITLPADQLPVRHTHENTEWAKFSNIRDAVHESDEGEWRLEMQSAQQNYRDSVAGALKALDAAPVLPDASHKTAQTDVVGLLRRISQTNPEGAEYAIILTDVADTRYRAMPKLPSPESPLRALVLLAPAQPKDAKMTLGRALSGPEQFDIRKHQLQKSVPWVRVVPYFTRNLAYYLDPMAYAGELGARRN